MLKIANDLSLPVDTVTQSLAILARKRAGKSYLARRFAEQLLVADQQVVIIDPKGDWWGIRSSSDAKSPGFPVVIFGGEHGDLPLELSAAETIARLIVEERVSVLLDLGDLKKSEVSRFLGGDSSREGLLELLYRLKSKQAFQTPVMLIVDEADAIAPQKPYPGQERMLGAMEDIVRRGGQRGLGSMLLTQRSSVINKDVLTQSQVMIALRTIAALDLKSIMEWVDVHGDIEQGKVLKASLPSLPIGQAWVLSPGWPTEHGIFKRITVLPITTFDSGATPKAGEKRLKPKNLADIDLEVISKRMAETIERKKASDPAELKKRIVELERACATYEKGTLLDSKEIAKAEEQGYRRGLIEGLKRAGGIAGAAVNELEPHIQAIRNITHGVAVDIQRGPALGDPALSSNAGRDNSGVPVKISNFREVMKPHADVEPLSRPAPAPTRNVIAGPGENLPRAERKILIALAQYPQGRRKTQIAILTGYAHNGGGFNNSLSSLRSKGYISGSDPVSITPSGLKALGSYEELPTGRALADYWYSQLRKSERSILVALVNAYPAGVDKIELGRRTEYEPNGGGFNNALSKLRSLELIEGRSELRASGDLF